MTETKWTRGPWWTDGKYNGQEMGCAIIAARTDCGPLPGNPTRGMVAWSNAILNTKARECEANAHLIAAAPDLYEALCWAIQSWDEHNKHGFNMQGDWVQDARAALSKARGDV